MKKFLALFILSSTLVLANNTPSTCNGVLNDLDIITDSMASLKTRVENLQMKPTKEEVEKMFVDITSTKTRIQHLFLYHPNEMGNLTNDYKKSYESLSIIEK